MREARAVWKTARVEHRWSECTVTVPIRTESGLLADWRKPSPETCVYRIYDAHDVLLYVGITNNLSTRWSEHAVKPWWRTEAHRYDVRWYSNRDVAKDIEKQAIISERPKCNQVHRHPALPLFKPGMPHPQV